MPFQSSNELILNQQLKIQEVCIRFSDVGLYTASGSVVTVNLYQPPLIAAVIHCDNSVPSAVLTAAASCVVTGNSVAITLANAFATSDCIIIKYQIDESV